MALDPARLLGMPPIEVSHTYTFRDTMLYALGVGAGIPDPVAPGELPYVYEAELTALPTMAVVLAYPGAWLRDPALGLDWKRLLHGEQTLTIHRPLRPEGTVIGRTSIDALFDKGKEKGALLYTSREIRDRDTDELVATAGMAFFLRGDGGFGGSSEGAPQPHPEPDAEPDTTVSLVTRPEQALIYRLSGDFNPLHADPRVAEEAGFSRPILHGLCTYGVAGRAAVGALCGGDATRLRRLDVRFSSPVYPGETLAVDIWRAAPGQALLRCRVEERNTVVLRHGYAEYEV